MKKKKKRSEEKREVTKEALRRPSFILQLSNIVFPLHKEGHENQGISRRFANRSRENLRSQKAPRLASLRNDREVVPVHSEAKRRILPRDLTG